MLKEVIALKKKKKTGLRFWIQLFFFILIAAISLNHNLEDSGQNIKWLSTASLHALCPFGGVVTIIHLISFGTFVKKVHMSSLVLFGIVLFLAVAFGAVFCGWICPLGTLQEWVSNLGKKIMGKRYNKLVPKKLDSALRYLRYVLLIMIVYKTTQLGFLVFQDIDPYYALFNFYAGDVTTAAFLVLGITILLSLFIERPWCKYACPLGALLGITNLFSVFKIRRNKNTCIDCKSCDRTCPMNIEVSKKESILNHQCIRCMKCTSEDACPIDDTVDLATKGAHTDETDY